MVYGTFAVILQTRDCGGCSAYAGIGKGTSSLYGSCINSYAAHGVRIGSRLQSTGSVPGMLVVGIRFRRLISINKGETGDWEDQVFVL